jgi:hypothetical protein
MALRNFSATARQAGSSWRDVVWCIHRPRTLHQVLAPLFCRWKTLRGFSTLRIGVI